jgi:hypothetical protein
LKPRTNKAIFLIAAIYLASRVVLIFPDDVEKKSKRLIFFQQHHTSIVNDSRQRLEFFVKLDADLPGKELTNRVNVNYIRFKSLRKSEPVIFYSGNRIFASPGDPYDFSC